MFLPFFHHQAKVLAQENLAQLPMLLKHYYPESQRNSADAIKSLYTAWLLRDVKELQRSPVSPILSQLQDPDFRCQQVGLSPVGLNDFLHIYDKLADDKLYWQDVPFSSEQQQHAFLLQQQHPILYSDLYKDLAWRQQMGLLCTVVISQQAKAYQLVDDQDALWRHGVDKAAITMWLANQLSSHRLRAWIAALMHSLSLACIRKLILKYGHSDDETELLQDVLYYQYRLSYWIAKDWGLPEDILFSLRQRFMCDKPFSDNTLIMQRAEHIAFIRDLRHHKQFSKRQCVQMLLSFQAETVQKNLDQLV